MKVVQSAETYDRETLAPVEGGLYDPVIFGPSQFLLIEAIDQLSASFPHDSSSGGWGALEIPTGEAILHLPVLPWRFRPFLQPPADVMRAYVAAWRRMKPDDDPYSPRSLLCGVYPWSRVAPWVDVLGMNLYDPFPDDDPFPLIEPMITMLYRVVHQATRKVHKFRELDAPEHFQLHAADLQHHAIDAVRRWIDGMELDDSTKHHATQLQPA